MKPFGERGTTDTSSAKEWKEEKLKLLLSIYTAAESVLFYKILKEETLAFKGISALEVRHLNGNLQF